MALHGETIRVKGYREFIRAVAKADRDTKRLVRTELLRIGESVRADADRRFEKFSPTSAHGYKVRVRQRGVLVEQSLRKTTGLNPGWGKKQMRVALIPALSSRGREGVLDIERAFARITARLNRS